MTNMKFYGLNAIDSDTSFTFTSASTANCTYLYDNERTPVLTSVGSNDATPEVWEFDFGVDVTFDSIYIDNHNIKAGKIEYWTGAAWADFSTPISWSGNADTTNYYEFTELTKQKVKLTMDTTQVVDAQKTVGELRVLSEIGTLASNPSEFVPLFKYKQSLNQTVKGGNVKVRFGKKFGARFLLSDAVEADVVLAETLYDRNDSFYIYPSGGSATNEDGETLTQRGYRLFDMYLVNILSNFEPSIKKNIQEIGTRIPVKVAEI